MNFRGSIPQHQRTSSVQHCTPAQRTFNDVTRPSLLPRSKSRQSGGDPGSPDIRQKSFADVEMHTDTSKGQDPSRRADAQLRQAGLEDRQIAQVCVRIDSGSERNSLRYVCELKGDCGAGGGETGNRPAAMAQACSLGVAANYSPPKWKALVSRYSSIPSCAPSRPRPDDLTPPKGASAWLTAPVLRPTSPASSASPKRKARAMSVV